MSKGNQERIFIQASIDADTMIAEMCPMPIITQDTFAMLCNSEMDLVNPQVFFYCVVRP